MRIGIVGAGPAGSLCASLLSSSGCEVLLFDHRGAWEKPCGGGVTHKGVDRYPFLRNCLETCRTIRTLQVVSPRNAQVEVVLEEPISIYSRSALNQLLLIRATDGGARFCQERVLDFRRRQTGWEVKTDKANHHVTWLVGADGVNSLVRRKLSSNFVPEDLMMTFGYRVPRDFGDRIEIKFFPKLLGYYWAFPRRNHVSFGICGRLSQHPTREIKEYLHHFLEDAGYLSNGSETQHWQVYSALIPSLRRQSFCDNSVCGDGWALLGDAAGFVDPITCEGIFFALRSAELLAQSLLEGRPLIYPDLCRQDFVADFIHAAELFEKFYAGRFLGSDFITRMVQATSRSQTLRNTMNAFVAGRQDYRTLRWHLIRKTPQVLLQMAGSVVR
jgi:flavin-dependent dehydrogenase